MIRRSSTVLLPLLVVLLVMAAGFAALSRITTSAFDRLEADQVEQDAQRVRIGLDSWVTLLRNYGATNSIWDSSYADVESGDAEAFASDFPPADVKTIYGLDGVLGVAPDGRLKVGGLASGERYVPPPGRLADPTTLAGLFDPKAEAGESRCVVLDPGGGAFLSCGFAAHRSDGSADGAGGLVFLRSLGGAGLRDLGRELSMPLHAVPAPAGAGGVDRLAGWNRMASSLGTLATSTRTVGPSTIALQVALPAGDGAPVVLEAMRPRPIHAEAVRVARLLMLVTGAIGLVVLAVVLAVSRLEVRRQLRPLRRTTELMTTTGDRSVRVAAGRGEIGALGRDINAMLDAIVEQDRRLEEANAVREQHELQAREQQRHSALVVRERAQAAVDDTVQAVLRELEQVVERADAVATAAAEIDRRVAATTEVTAGAHGFAAEGERGSTLVSTSLQHVGGITETIGTVARQTHLLALNATIEAARAGAAGLGFSVVADEVKQLAGHTAESADQISRTLSKLDTDVSALTDVITRMTSAVGGIDRETELLLTVTADQRSNLDALREQLDSARRTIEDLGRVTDSIERRGHERIPVAGRVTVVFAAAPGSPWTGSLLDLSASGLRCRVTGPGALPGGEQVTVLLDTAHGDAELRARVARRTPGPDGVELGLSLPEPADGALLAILDRLGAA